MKKLAKNHSELGSPAQQNGCSTNKGGCCQCQQVIKEMSCGQGSSKTAGIGEVLLVFFLPLACAAGVVIWAVHSWSGLAEHPGYLALTALAVVCGALTLAKVLTRRAIHQAKDEQEEK